MKHPQNSGLQVTSDFTILWLYNFTTSNKHSRIPAVKNGFFKWEKTAGYREFCCNCCRKSQNKMANVMLTMGLGNYRIDMKYGCRIRPVRYVVYYDTRLDWRNKIFTKCILVTIIRTAARAVIKNECILSVMPKIGLRRKASFKFFCPVEATICMPLPCRVSQVGVD